MAKKSDFREAAAKESLNSLGDSFRVLDASIKKVEEEVNELIQDYSYQLLRVDYNLRGYDSTLKSINANLKSINNAAMKQLGLLNDVLSSSGNLGGDDDGGGGLNIFRGKNKLSENIKRRRNAEKRAAEKRAAEKLAAEKKAAEKLAAEKRAAEKLAAEKMAAEREAERKRLTENAVAEKATAEEARRNLEAELQKQAAERMAAEERLKNQNDAIKETKQIESNSNRPTDANKVVEEAKKVAAEKVAAEKVAAEKVAAEKVAVKKAKIVDLASGMEFRPETRNWSDPTNSNKFIPRSTVAKLGLRSSFEMMAEIKSGKPLEKMATRVETRPEIPKPQAQKAPVPAPKTPSRLNDIRRATLGSLPKLPNRANPLVKFTPGIGSKAAALIFSAGAAAADVVMRIIIIKEVVMAVYEMGMLIYHKDKNVNEKCFNIVSQLVELYGIIVVSTIIGEVIGAAIGAIVGAIFGGGLADLVTIPAGIVAGVVIALTIPIPEGTVAALTDYVVNSLSNALASSEADMPQYASDANKQFPGMFDEQGRLTGFSDGGLSVGPLSGYPVTLHGTEFIIPLNAQTREGQLGELTFNSKDLIFNGKSIDFGTGTGENKQSSNLRSMISGQGGGGQLSRIGSSINGNRTGNSRSGLTSYASLSGSLGGNSYTPSIDMNSVKGVEATGSAEQAINFFVSKGWTREQAIGIAANLEIESGFKTNVLGDNGAAYGIAQWHPDRQAIFREWAGKDIRESTFEEQLGFVNYELNGPEKKAGDMLRNTTDAISAAAAVDIYYERSKGLARTARMQKAAEYAKGDKGGTVVTTDKNPGKDISGMSVATEVANRNNGTASKKSIVNNINSLGGKESKSVISPEAITAKQRFLANQGYII